MQGRDSLLIHRAWVSPGLQQGFSHTGCVGVEQRRIAGLETGVHVQSMLYKYGHTFCIYHTVQGCITTDTNSMRISPCCQ